MRVANMRKVSVVVPNCSHARFLRWGIESVWGKRTGICPPSPVFPVSVDSKNP
jgi:hypothetical protein